MGNQCDLTRQAVPSPAVAGEGRGGGNPIDYKREIRADALLHR